jgi:hypothetical protein
LLISCLAIATLPHPVPGQVPGPLPDSPDYAYGALALLHGHYTVSWDGLARVPRYSPGFPLLLVPAVALGGVAAAVWVSWLALIALATGLAALAWRVGGCWAAPLAVVLLFGATPLHLAQEVMSDLPSAALLLAEGALVACGTRRRTVLAAGAVAGLLIWIRPANALLVLAGCAALTVWPPWRARVPVYLAAIVPFIAALALWQWRVYGSPLQTGYQAAVATADGSGTLGALFAPRYVFGHPWNYGDVQFQGQSLPNVLDYPLALSGVAGAYFPLPGSGILGLWGLVRLAWQRGVAASMGRFGLAMLALTLLVYLPYFFQESRFMLAPATFLALGAAVQVGRISAWLLCLVSQHRHLPCAQPHRPSDRHSSHR